MAAMTKAKVSWIDSSLQNSQVDASEFPTPTEIVSIGFVVADERDYLTLARDDMQHDGDYRGLLAIPREAIHDIVPLSETVA